MLDIISITRNDLAGILQTVGSTRTLRAHAGVRHIVVDGSDEPIRREVESALESEPAVVYVFAPPNGISNAFNEGIRVSQARWLWFMNGGDLVHPTLDVDLFLRLVAIGTSDAMAFQIEFNGKVFLHAPVHELWPPYPNYWVHHQAILLRRQMIVDLGGYSPEYSIAMDLDLWLRMFLRGARCDIVSFPLGIFMDGGISHDKKRLHAERALVIRRLGFKIFKRWTRNGLESLQAWYGFWRSGRS